VRAFGTKRTPQASFAKSAYGSKSDVEMVISLVCRIRFARQANSDERHFARSASRPKNRLRANRNFANRFDLIWVVQPALRALQPRREGLDSFLAWMTRRANDVEAISGQTQIKCFY
jgi:hypothetical protein